MSSIAAAWGKDGQHIKWTKDGLGEYETQLFWAFLKIQVILQPAQSVIKLSLALAIWAWMFLALKTTVLETVIKISWTSWSLRGKIALLILTFDQLLTEAAAGISGLNKIHEDIY